MRRLDGPVAHELARGSQEPALERRAHDAALREPSSDAERAIRWGERPLHRLERLDVQSRVADRRGRLVGAVQMASDCPDARPLANTSVEDVRVCVGGDAYEAVASR